MVPLRRLWISVSITTICLYTYLAVVDNSPIALAFSLSYVSLSTRTAHSTAVLSAVSTDDNNNNSDTIVSIEQARIPHDLPAIRACRQTAFAATEAEETDQLPFPRLASQISFCNATSVGTGAALCFVARQGASSSTTRTTSTPTMILGTLDYKPTTHTIQNVLVRPDYRGQGLARRLVAACETAAVAAATNVVFLDVNTANTPAYRLYQSMGYRPDGPLHAFSAKVGDTLGTGLLVRMRKDLSVSSSSPST